MAELINQDTQERVYLTKYHLFGRKKNAVNTFTDNPSISRVHMVIEWKNEQWVIQNKSRNGVWLNSQPLIGEQQYMLQYGDKIALNASSTIAFTVNNLSHPQDKLVQCSPAPDFGNSIGTTSSTTLSELPHIIALNQVNLLPNDAAPEIIVYYSTERHTWMCENAMSLVSNPVQEGDLIHFANTDWMFYTSANQSDPATLESETSQNSDPKYVFHISQDEEFAILKIKHNEIEIDMDARSHHYLTALLARYKNQTANIKTEDSLQGWIPIKKLSKDLGLSESHINIQIHRARKQIEEQFQRFGLTAPEIIERRRGYARFASDNFSIFKGNQQEA